MLDFRKTGRNLYRMLHAVIGGWVLVFYLVSGFTGLWWSYDWYRQGVRALLVAEAPAERHKGPKDVAVDLPRAWDGFVRATGGRTYDRITLNVRDYGEVQFRAKLPDARHDRVSDELTIDGTTGAVNDDQPYATRPLGEDIVTSMFELHRGAYFGMVGRIAMLLASLTMPLFTITGFLLYFARRRRKAALAAVVADVGVSPPTDNATTIVAYASHTGSAERIARLTADALPDAAALPIAALDRDTLSRATRLFVVASTYGEGEPPDNARGFARTMEREAPDLSHLDYAVMALGDREYAEFCAFGHRVDRWLHDQGATRLFDAVEADGNDADAQRQWQHQLAGLGARTDQSDWAPAAIEDWRLVERRLLNPGSSGGEAWLVTLEPVAAAADWMPGDIVEILPQQDVRRVDAYLATAGLADTPDNRALLMTSILPTGVADVAALKPIGHREYSIASIPASGRVELIVRRCTAADGFDGLGSGWLCNGAPVGGVVRARVRSNPAFHPPADNAVPLILIGNGTGLAGLLAHLRHRGASVGGPAMLYWGERHPAQDDFLAGERQALVDTGVLADQRIAWSRRPGGHRYVQDAVAADATNIRTAVGSGAAIYVCGSVQGMAPGVHAALATILGESLLEEMLSNGRYRRDIY